MQVSSLETRAIARYWDLDPFLRAPVTLATESCRWRPRQEKLSKEALCSSCAVVAFA